MDARTTGDDRGVTPLYHAFMSQRREAALFLVQAGARLFEYDSRQCPCNCAAQKGYVAMVELLMASQRWQSMCREDRLEAERMLLHLAADVQTQNIVLQYALDRQNMISCRDEKTGGTALHTAIGLERKAVVIGGLIKLGVDVKAEDAQGDTAEKIAEKMALVVGPEFKVHAECLKRAAGTSG